MTLTVLRDFFFWNSVINMGLLLFSLTIILTARKMIYKIHGSMFNLSDSQLNQIWYTILGFYKIAVFVFNIVPYVALRIMTG